MDKNVRRAILGVCLIWLIFIAYMAVNSPVRALTPTYTEYEYAVAAGGQDVQYNTYADVYYDNMTQLFVAEGSHTNRVLMRFTGISIPKYEAIVEWGVICHVPAAYAFEATDGHQLAVTYDLYAVGTAPTINAAYLDAYDYDNGAINRVSSDFTRSTVGNNTLYIGHSSYSSNFWPGNLTDYQSCVIDVVFESPISGDVVAFDSFESGNPPVLYIKVEDYNSEYELIEELRGGYTIYRKTNDVQLYGLAGVNKWVSLPVTCEISGAQVTLEDAGTYNSTFIAPDGYYGEPYTNETYNGNAYGVLYHVTTNTPDFGLSRLQATYDGDSKVAVFGFERVWGTQVASKLPVAYICGYSYGVSASWGNRVTNGWFEVATEVRSEDANTVKLSGDCTVASAEAGTSCYVDEGQVYLMLYEIAEGMNGYGGSNYLYHYHNRVYDLNVVTGEISYKCEVEYHFNCTEANWDSLNRIELADCPGDGAFDINIECYLSRGFIPEKSYAPVYVVFDPDGIPVGEFPSLAQAENYVLALEPEWSLNSWDYVCFFSMLAVFAIPVKIADDLKNLNMSGVFMWLVIECFFAALFMSWIMTVA